MEESPNKASSFTREERTTLSKVKNRKTFGIEEPPTPKGATAQTVKNSSMTLKSFEVSHTNSVCESSEFVEHINCYLDQLEREPAFLKKDIAC